MRPLSFQSNLESYKNLPQKHLNQFEYQTKSPVIQMARDKSYGREKKEIGQEEKI